MAFLVAVEILDVWWFQKIGIAETDKFWDAVIVESNSVGRFGFSFEFKDLLEVEFGLCYNLWVILIDICFKYSWSLNIFNNPIRIIFQCIDNHPEH